MTTALSLAKERYDHECRDQQKTQGFPRCRHRPGRMGPARNCDRRDRDAGPDVGPRRVRAHETARGRAHRRLPAHDDPDGGAHRIAGRARRRGPLGVLQHLLDAGPCRRRDRRRRHSGLRAQGRDARGVLGLRASHLRVARRQARQHDPRRRRRRDAAPDAGRRGGARSVGDFEARERGRNFALRVDQEAPRIAAGLVLGAPRRDQGRHRGDHDGREAPVPEGCRGQAAVPRDQRERLGHQVEVRQPLRLPRVARRRHQARDGRDDRRQDHARRRLRRRRQGLRTVPARPRSDRLGHRDRPDLRAAGGDGRLSRRDHGRRLRQGGHLRDARPAT